MPEQNSKRPWAFHKIKDANREIARLESELGLAPSPPGLSIVQANRRIDELQTLKLTRAAVPSVSRPAIGSPAAPAQAGGLPRAKREAIAVALGMDQFDVKSASDGALAENMAKLAFQSYVTFPGCPSDAELSALHWRSQKSRADLTGLDRHMAAMKQTAINNILDSQ
jgi:hypothetical protein